MRWKKSWFLDGLIVENIFCYSSNVIVAPASWGFASITSPPFSSIILIAWSASSSETESETYPPQSISEFSSV